jgi:hypothetical protein
MEIEFNPSRIPPSGYSETVARRGASRVNADPESMTGTTGLQDQLNALPEVRPDKIERAKALAADDSYPPDYLLDRIARLLAIQIEQ